MKPVKDGKRGNTGFEEWGGYMEAKKQKLKNQFEKGISEELMFTEEGPNIFQGISIFVNGYTNPPLDKLRRLMMRHGGTFRHYYSRKSTTHIIATNLPYSKMIKLKDEKVVKPEWITDSVKAGKLLPDYNYLLYAPSSKGQGRLDFGVKSAKKISSINEQLPEDCNTTKMQETEDSLYGSVYSEIKGNSLLEQICDKDFAKKVFNVGEKCLNTETENYASNILNQVEEFSSETFKNLQITINDSESRNHKQFSHFTPNLHNEQSPSLRAGAPNFISEFYNHSRLHHISTAKSNFQMYVIELRNCKNRCFTGREKLKELYQNDIRNCTNTTNRIDVATDSNPVKIFMHIDMDCFFASVSLLKYPHLKGKPVAVTHSKTGICQPLAGSNIEYEEQYYKMYNMNNGNQQQLSSDGLLGKMDVGSEVTCTNNPMPYCGSRSEIASCNYHARTFGVHNGMFVGEAKKLCPELHMIPYDFEGYETVSKLLYDTVASYTLDIQAVSCDEMYVDCTSVLAETTASPLQFASVLRREIESKTGCTASAGLGSNLLLARLATKTAKPNGQYFIEPHFSEEFMKQQLVKDLPGVGYVLESRLKAMGIVTCEDLQNVSIGKLQNEFGLKTGKMFFEYCHGIDFREIQKDNKRKSVSAEINYGMRFQQLHEVKRFLKELAEEVQSRLQKINMRGKSITLKLKVRKEDAPIEPAKFMGHGICDNITKTLQLGSATNNSVVIGRACIVLLQNMKLQPEDIRGVGIQVGRLEQLSVKSNSSNQVLLNFVQKTDRSDNVAKKQSDNVAKKQSLSFSPPKLYRPETNRSFSEVDPEVFAALPEELKNEIMEYYNGNNNNTTVQETGQSQETYFPTTSSVNAGRNSINSRAERYIANEFTIGNQPFDLPNFSQIDPDVLTALPDELKCEIIEAYNCKVRAEEQSSPNKRHQPANTLMSLLKQSPCTKRKITKAKRSPVSKLLNGNKCNNNTKQSSSRQSNVMRNVIQKSIFAENEKNSCYVNKETKTEAESCKEPNLCGAITIDDVKNLLTEWVSSSENSAPEEEDVALFSQYIVDVTMEKNLEKLNRIIKYFYRLVKKTESICWQKSYLDLITAMQSTMLQIYGSTLKIETDF